MCRDLLSPYFSVRIDLGGNADRSAFSRFGYNDVWMQTGDERERHRMRTHMARHWLNTVANKSGMTAFQVTMWMRRSDERQTKLYLHDSKEIADVVRERIDDGTLQGQLADEYRGIAEQLREEYLDTIMHAHKTAVALCAKNFLQDGCQYQKRCESCRFSLFESSDKRSIIAIRERHEQARHALNYYDGAIRSGRKLHPRQRELVLEQIKATEQILEHSEKVRAEKRRV